MEVKTIEVANVKTETLKNLENVRPLPSTSLTPSPKGKARVGRVLYATNLFIIVGDGAPTSRGTRVIFCFAK